MTLFDMALKSLRYHFRNHLGVLLGVALSTAVIVGALLVGDSLRYSLKKMGEQRLMNVGSALISQDRFFRAELADDLEVDGAAPAMYLPASAANNDGDRRVNKVQVIGVEDRFWALGNTDSLFNSELGDRQMVINDVLAEQLEVEVGDNVVVRVANPSLMPRDAPFSTEDDVTLAVRAEVAAVAGPAQFGRFSLQASQRAPATVFVPLSYLQKRLELEGKANLLLSVEHPTDDAMAKAFKLADAALELIEIPGQDAFELRSDRVFVDDVAAEASKASGLEQLRVLTYFGNAIVAGTNATPFSMVAGFEGESFLPGDLADDEAVINDWLADDLGLGVGDAFDVKYYVIGDKRTLEERTTSFKVREVIPIEGLASDPELMPNLPGITDSEDCSDWEPGMPLDLKQIRDKDEVYWDDHRGTPKAFIKLGVAQELWTNRFGALTAIRYAKSGQTREGVETALLAKLDPMEYGLTFIPVADQAAAAGAEGLDLGQYFAYFSFFIIVAALALGAMLFLFGIEQRRDEIAALFAMGYRPKLIRKLLLRESLVVVLLGSTLGIVGGLGYTLFLLRGLSGAWSGAIGSAPVEFFARPATMVIGALIGALVGVGVLWFALRKYGKSGVSQLFAGTAPARLGGARQRMVLIVVAVLSALGSAALAFTAGAQQAGAFFGAGALVLIAGLCFSALGLQQFMRMNHAAGLGLGELGMRQAGRNRGRSLVAIWTLAAGVFMVIGVGAFRQAGGMHLDAKTSGTGGFAFVVETAQAVFSDLNDAAVREELLLDDPEFDAVRFVQLRLREGEEASCLNLNKAQRPQVLGVNPKDLLGRFTFAKSLAGEGEDPWTLLDAPPGEDGAIPAIADNNSIMYALMSGVGKTITHTDEQGREIKLKLVAGASNSILQGSVLISEAQFVRLYPSASGYRRLLVDAPVEVREQVADEFQKALREVGPEMVGADQRLAEYNQVQNTYISVFQALGGLGVLLGTVGLAVIVLRNVLERRRELGVLEAVGFTRSKLRGLVCAEHLLLLVVGLVVGVLAAGVALVPMVRQPEVQVPWLEIALLLVALVMMGWIWVSVAARIALRRRIIDALGND